MTSENFFRKASIFFSDGFPKLSSFKRNKREHRDRLCRIGTWLHRGSGYSLPIFHTKCRRTKNYNWPPVLTGGQKTFLYQDLFRTLGLIWKTLPFPPQKSFYFNWQKGYSWTHGCHFSFSPPFSVKFSLKTFHFFVLMGFCGIFLLIGAYGNG